MPGGLFACRRCHGAMMRVRYHRQPMRLLRCVPLALVFAIAVHAQQVRNVVVVMTDGFRWQEMFRGADPALLTPDRYYDGRDVSGLQQQFLAGSPEQQRQKLLPFFWQQFTQHGVIFGDVDAGGSATVTNGLQFSYPGYSETLTGHADPRIHSNDDVPNPNQTVLAWLNHQPEFKGEVAAFGAWHVIANAVNAAKCECVDNAAYDPLVVTPSSPAIDLLNKVKQDAPRIWDDESFDAPTFYTALEYVKLAKPRVLYLSMGETDDWAHGNNYGEYLLSAHRVDDYMQQLWAQLQSMPEYRDSTALIFLTDHGRGSLAAKGDHSWTTHGEKVPEAKNIFIAVSAPGLSGGVRSDAVTQSQVAATIARLLGKDWNAAEPLAGKPLPVLAPSH